jgi:hypothetical protein
MPVGIRLKQGEVVQTLSSLDVDEGVRVEGKGGKMFVNRSASGTFVVQVGKEFHYLDSAAQVMKLAAETLGKYSAWAY